MRAREFWSPLSSTIWRQACPVRFKLDENLPAEMADLFNRAGHDAVTVLDQQLVGVSDPDLATVCVQERHAIVTWIVTFRISEHIGPAHIRESSCSDWTIRHATIFCKLEHGFSIGFPPTPWTVNSGSLRNREFGCVIEQSLRPPQPRPTKADITAVKADICALPLLSGLPGLSERHGPLDGHIARRPPFAYQNLRYKLRWR